MLMSYLICGIGIGVLEWDMECWVVWYVDWEWKLWNVD